AFDMKKPSISHHLDLLKRADLVASQKRGQFVVYTINTTVLDDVLSWIFSLKQSHPLTDPGHETL
ncbi:MAG: transcriptional regulator, partial [Bacteroidota bacterium]